MRTKGIVLVFFGVLLMFSLTSVSAHEDHFEGANNLTAPQVILMAFGAGFLPMLAGYFTYLLMQRFLAKREMSTLITDGISLGILVFLIFDYLNLTAFLGLNSPSFLSMIALLAVAVFVFLAFVWVVNDDNSSKTLYLLWAIGLGFHSFSEGIIMGYNFHLDLSLILRFFPALSFLMHKFAEGVTGAALIHRREAVSWKYLLLYAVISGLTIIPGVLVGFFITADTGSFINYFYAASFGSILFILPFYFPKEEHFLQKKLGFYFWMLMGFLFVYVGAYFHEI